MKAAAGPTDYLVATSPSKSSSASEDDTGLSPVSLRRTRTLLRHIPAPVKSSRCPLDRIGRHWRGCLSASPLRRIRFAARESAHPGLGACLRRSPSPHPRRGPGATPRRGAAPAPWSQSCATLTWFQRVRCLCRRRMGFDIPPPSTPLLPCNCYTHSTPLLLLQGT